MRSSPRMTQVKTYLLHLFVLLSCCVVSAAAESLFPLNADLPQYEASEIENIHLSSVGSDSMGNLVETWAKVYKVYNPKAQIRITSRGSSAAPLALMEGSADLGAMARNMKAKEESGFRARLGFPPTQIRVAIAGVGVYVSERNPIEKISFEELDAIFSSTFKRGAANKLQTWGDLEEKSPMAPQRIKRVGRAPGSFPFTYFRQRVMLQGEFGTEVLRAPDPNGLLTLVAGSPRSIGYGELRIPPKGLKLVLLPALTSIQQ